MTYLLRYGITDIEVTDDEHDKISEAAVSNQKFIKLKRTGQLLQVSKIGLTEKVSDLPVLQESSEEAERNFVKRKNYARESSTT